MKLENTLSIPVPADEAWRVLLDIERIAPCVPGATLTGNDGESYRGKIKVKLGAIGLTYNGAVRFLSQDADAKVAVLEASGREMRGNGTAKAQVTCRLVGTGDSTDVYVETDLAITGKPAQFGRGALAEVSAALIDRFSANLAGELAASAPDTAVSGGPVPDAPAEAVDGSAGASAAPPPVTVVVEASAPSANGQAPPTTSRPAAEPLDLMDLAGAGVLKRVAPYAAGAAALLLVAFGLRGRRRPRAVEVVVVRCCDHAATGAVRHAVDQAITRAR